MSLTAWRYTYSMQLLLPVRGSRALQMVLRKFCNEVPTKEGTSYRVELLGEQTKITCKVYDCLNGHCTVKCPLYARESNIMVNMPVQYDNLSTMPTRLNGLDKVVFQKNLSVPLQKANQDHHPLCTEDMLMSFQADDFTGGCWLRQNQLVLRLTPRRCILKLPLSFSAAWKVL